MNDLDPLALKHGVIYFAGEVYIRRQMQYIFNRFCSIYSTAFAVYIQSLMQYIFIFKGYVLAEAGIPIF